jgi:UbiD family decarboxylase
MVAQTSGNPPEALRATPSVFDFRAWIEKVRAIGQLREVENADLHLELGAITELNAKRRGPALLFSGFPGIPPGFRVLTGAMLNARTLGLTMGVEEKLDTMALTNRIGEKLQTIQSKPIEGHGLSHRICERWPGDGK